MSRPNFCLFDRTGGGVTRNVCAADAAAAISQARVWMASQSDAAGGALLSGSVWPIAYTADGYIDAWSWMTAPKIDFSFRLASPAATMGGAS